MLLSKGRLVKGSQFKNHKDAGNVITTAKVYNTQGADELLLVDIDASIEGYKFKLDVIESISEVINIPITIGGNINSLNDALNIIKAGADKIIINSLFFDNPDEVNKISNTLGKQAVVIALDIIKTEKNYMVYDYSNKKKLRFNLEKLFEYASKIKFGEIRLLSVDREGTKMGPDLDLFRLFSEFFSVPIIYEGGINKFDDLSYLIDNGCRSIALGTSLIFSDMNIFKIKYTMHNYGYNLRVI